MGKGLTRFAASSVVALSFAGCGSDDDATPADGIAKAAFVKRANAVCVRNYNRMRREFQSFVRGVQGEPFSTGEEIREYADTVLIPLKRRKVEELRELGSPDGDEGEVEAIAEAYEEGIETAEEDPRAAITSTFGVFTEAIELAQEYGLDRCRI